MEDQNHGGGHPLMLHAAGRLHLHRHPSAYTTTWVRDDDPHEQQQLRDALLRALGELDASRAELRRVESERDELRRHYHSLLLLLLHHHSSQPPPEFELQGCAAAMDDLQGITTAASMSSEEGDYAEAELERRLRENGQLVEAVLSAGPLLQTLLLAGPLPRWRHPPADLVIPPFNPGANSSASYSSPESDNCGGGPALPVVVALPLGQRQLPQQQQDDALPCFRVITSSPFCVSRLQ